MGLFTTLFNDFQPLAVVTKNSILDFLGVLDMLLKIRTTSNNLNKPDLFFCFFIKASYKIKANGQHLSFNIYM